MKLFARLRSALRNLLHSRTVDQDLDAELRAHLEMLIAEKIAAGTPGAEARRQALIEIGGAEVVKEQVRDARNGNWLDQAWQDARYGSRMLRKAPGMTAAALLAMTLGIGATTLMFTVVDRVLLSPLPYRDSERIVHMTGSFKKEPGMSISWLDLGDIREQNRVFTNVVGINPRTRVITDGGRPEQIDTRYVSHDFLTTLGIGVALGRDLTAEDDVKGAAPVALISHALWESRFGSASDAIDKTITLDHQAYTVVGVLPRGFTYRDMRPAVLLPIGQLLSDGDFATKRSAHAGTYAVARLKPGVTLDQAHADLDRIAKQLQAAYPDSNKDIFFNAIPLRERMVGDVRPALLMLLAGVGCLLLVACANVASLLLTRSTARRRELAVRCALGASRTRLIRQLLTESLLLALAGGIAGCLLAYAGTQLLVWSAPDSLPRIAELHMNGEALAFSALISVFTGLLFGTAPAWQASSTHPEEALKDQTRGGTAKDGVRKALVVGELALSLVLLVISGLLVRSFHNAMRVDLGFEPDGVLTANMSIPETKYPKPQQVEQVFDQAMANIRSIPGVSVAAAGTPLPLSGNEWDTGVRTDRGDVTKDGGYSPEIKFIAPGYLAGLKVSLIAGREMAATDNDAAPAVVMVNESFAKRAWPGESALGKRLRLGGPKELNGSDFVNVPWRTVVGVIGDEKQEGPTHDTPPQVIMPYAQHFGTPPNVITFRNLIIRSETVPPASLAEAVRAAVLRADADEALGEVRTMNAMLGDWLASRKLTMYLLCGFATFALVLTVIGLYAVVSYWVLQRRRELGIRMALGASREKVLRMVMGQGMRLALVGAALGTAGALASARLVTGLLFGVPPHDLATLLAITTGLLAVMLTACLIPARRATRVEPSVALRME